MIENRVNYDAEFIENTANYPMRRIPHEGTIVRSHRFGKFKQSNAEFSQFKYELEQIFGGNYIISGDARMNTGGANRPFDLDLALIHRKDDSIRINIEVDEPYSLFSREARHCRGEDDLRDNYFLERGWAVIRFSENQVHRNMEGCLRFIAESLNEIDANFEMPAKCLNFSKPNVDLFWDLVQAQKWEKASFRESYLKVELALEKPNIELDRSFNAQEIHEEELVKASFSGTMEFVKDHRNTHIRDERIEFNVEQHKYFVDGIPFPSASTLVNKFFPEFDAFGAANRLRRGNPLYGMPVDEIVDTWNKRGQEAADKGTFLHEQIENYYLGNQFTRTEEFSHFEDFTKTHSFLKPYRCEWRIYDEEFGLAGTIDFVAENDGRLEIYDWKRSKKVIDPTNGKPIENDKWGKHGLGKLGNMGDTSYNHYCLQQSLYRFMLEKNYGVEISKMYLIVIHPDYDSFYKVEVPYMKNYVIYLLNTL